MRIRTFPGAAMIAVSALFLAAPAHNKAPFPLPSGLGDAPASGTAAGQLGGAALSNVNYGAPAPQPGLSAAAPSSQAVAEGNTAAEIALRCAKAAADEPVLRQSDFRWDYTLPEMLARFDELYISPKRLAARAYWDAAAETIRLPYMDERGGAVEISPSFIQAVARHIERGLELKYVDSVFFPDMGHSHILIPEKLWRTKYDLYPVGRMSDMYRDMFRDPRLRIFYHTAEQLKTRGADGQLVNDERTKFRYETRNISGFIKSDADLTVHKNPGSSANTVSEVPGYFWWGAGFNISAQRDGCFVYHSGGRSYRFDLSLFDLPEEPGSGFDKAEKKRVKAFAALRYAPVCILKVVAEQMGQKYRPEIPLPKIFFEHAVPLVQFQDAVETQWGVRPALLSNVYAWSRNEIYLMDDAAWYKDHERSIDDSLAHELVHYIQHRYRGWDLGNGDPFYEPQAIEFQTWFRENYILKPGTCPAD